MNQETAAPRTDWGLVLLIFSAGVVAAFQVGKAPPSLPLLRADLKMSLFAAGWVISTYTLVGVVSGGLIGALADWLGHRRLALAGLGCLGLASLAGGLAQGPAGLLTSRFFEGLGYVVVIVSAPVLIIRTTHPADQRLALGLWSAFMPAGASTMMLLSPLGLQSFGWRGLWLANALLVGLFILVFAWSSRSLTDSTPARKRPSILNDLKLILSQPGPRRLALCFGAYSLQFLALIGFLPTLLIEDLGIGQARAAALSAGVLAMNVPGNLLGGWLLQRGVRRATLVVIASAFMGLAAVGIYSHLAPAWVRYCLCLLFSGLGGIIPASLFAAVPSHSPRPSLVAMTNGLVAQGANLGSTLGPPILAAVVWAAGGWQGGWWLLIVAAGLTIWLALGLGRLERQSEREGGSTRA